MIQPAARSSSSKRRSYQSIRGMHHIQASLHLSVFFWPPGSVFEPQQARYDRQDEHLACSNLVAFQDHQQGEHLKADCCSCTTMHSAPTLLFLHSHHNMGIQGRHHIQSFFGSMLETQTPPLLLQVHQRKEAFCLKACTLCSSYAGSTARVGSLRLLVEKS